VKEEKGEVDGRNNCPEFLLDAKRGRSKLAMGSNWGYLPGGKRETRARQGGGCEFTGAEEHG